MKTYIIKQKNRATGSYKDLESPYYDRGIPFPPGTQYAVVLASIYGNWYSTHKTAKTAIMMSRMQSKYHHSIIDVQGNRYTVAGDKLVKNTIELNSI